ncbi:MAG: SDR family oxidoreductase [Treponemataceae bacterium]|nr:SDR family oxidoreductase [Treponemataceae bacterium]
MASILLNKRTLVIGGTSGIGRAICEAFAREGVELFITGGHNEKHLQHLIAHLRQEEKKCSGMIVPLSSVKDISSLTEWVPEVDILVCAWGPFLRKALEEYSFSDWQYLVEANLAIPGALISHYFSAMKRQKWGRIILFGGTDTTQIRGFSTTIPYSAAKTGLGVLARSVARSGAPYHITCNLLCPGMVDTEHLTEESRAYALQKAPGRTLILPEEIADTVVYLVTHESINGVLMSLDRGIVL